MEAEHNFLCTIEFHGRSSSRTNHARPRLVRTMEMRLWVSPFDWSRCLRACAPVRQVLEEWHTSPSWDQTVRHV